MYKFVSLPEFENIQKPLLAVMEESAIKGTLLLAAEGINGTVAGSQAAIERDVSLKAPANWPNSLNLFFTAPVSVQ